MKAVKRIRPFGYNELTLTPSHGPGKNETPAGQ